MDRKRRCHGRQTPVKPVTMKDRTKHCKWQEELEVNRIQRVSSWLKEMGHTAAFIHTKENVFYLTGFYTEPHERLMGLFIFQEEEPFLCVSWNGSKPGPQRRLES